MPLASEAIDARIAEHRTADAVLTLTGSDGRPIANTAVTVRQTRHKFLFGCNFYMFDRCRTPEQNRAYEKRFRDLLNFATLGFYWTSYEPREGQTLAADRRKAAQWCAENGVRTKGHPLFWTYEPRWTRSKSEAEAESAMWGRIVREVEAFDGLIDTWDVLNEPVVGPKQAEDRAAATIQRVYERDGRLKVIERAFDLARKANPKATLILNDFQLGDPFEKIVEDSLAAGVTIDTIGLQSHMHGGYSGAQRFWDVCERFKRFGKPLHFTEATILSGHRTKRERVGTQVREEFASSPEEEAKQARDIVDFYRALFSHPAVEAITWWDFSDQGAWKSAPAGLLREDMSPKPAYEALMGLIKGEWWTGPLELRTDAEGKVSFRGFLGGYEVEGESERATFALNESGDAEVKASLARLR